MARPLSLLALVALLLGGCSRPVREAEPNGEPAQATILQAGGAAEGTVSSPGDEDWYKVVVARDSGVLSAHVGGIRNVDFVISFRGADNVELKRLDETGVGGDERALDLGVTRGEFFLVLSNKNPKADNPGQKYLLTTRLESAAGREREPDDRLAQAAPLELNGVTRGHYFPSTNLLSYDPEHIEDDWFRIKADRDGVFSLSLDLGGVPNVDPVVEFYDAGGYKLKEVNATGTGEGESLKNLGVRSPQEYFVRLRTRGRRMVNPDVSYELLSELRPYDGRVELEPNDQRADATAFEKDALSGFVSPAGDEDWYAVSAATSPRQMLRADLSSVPGLDLVLTVTDDLGLPLRVVDNAGRDQPETLTGLGVGSATTYLVVSEKTGKAFDSRNAYALRKVLAPWQAGLEWEPNDSTATAQALRVGESVDGYLAPQGDRDVYEFNAYQKGAVLFELSGVINVRWSADLIDQDGRTLLSPIASRAGESLSFESELEPGTYWIAVAAADGGQNNVRDKYTLRLREK